MADTARPYINDATRQIRKRGVSETLSAQDAADCLRDLNTLLRSLELGQFRQIPGSDLTLNEEVIIPDELSQAFTALLAVKLSAMYGIDPPAVVVAAANRGSADISRFRLRHGTAVIDDGLLNMPSFRFSRGA